MLAFRPRFPIRTTIALAFTAAASLAAGSALTGVLQAQELPAGVASGLVDRALERQLEAPPATVAQSPREWAPRTLSWFTMALALVLLVTGWARGEFVSRRSKRDEAAVRSGAPDEDGEAAHRPRSGKRRDARPESGQASSPRVADEGSSPPTPKEALVLPSHVTEVLERAAAKRRAEALVAEGGQADAERAANSAPAAEPAGESLDLLVPGYDPWKGR